MLLVNFYDHKNFSLLFSFGMGTIGVTISGHMSWPQPI